MLLLLPPLAFAVFEGLHPRPDVEIQAVMDVATWFAAFHAIQLLLMGLVALTVLMLADEFGVAGTWTTRLGIGVFSGLGCAPGHQSRRRRPPTKWHRTTGRSA